MNRHHSGGHTCVVGLGWGDEGKGKIVDLLCADYDIVVRYNGGANAGHTVCIGEETFALHLLPTGVLHPTKTAVIGPGVVIDPFALIAEVDALEKRGTPCSERLRISDRAHLVMPYHQLEDRLREEAAAEREQIGTTSRGIGPCYADKMRRSTAFRVCDLFDPATLKQRLTSVVSEKCVALSAVFAQEVAIDADELFDRLRTAAERLKPLVRNSTAFLADAMSDGRRVLFEGANGTLLDVDHGTYPYVTSSGTTAGGVPAGAGVPGNAVQNVLGVVKAYATRVGKGPFITELNNEKGDRIRERGREYGTTTGRPRRCGWFDAVATRYGIQLGGVTEVALMHLDTLTGFEQVGVCTAYRVDGKETRSIPASADQLEAVEPIFEMLPGWDADVRAAESRSALPEAARRYLDRLEALIEAPISIVSVGPERSQTLVSDTRVLTPPVSVGGS